MLKGKIFLHSCVLPTASLVTDPREECSTSPCPMVHTTRLREVVGTEGGGQQVGQGEALPQAAGAAYQDGDAVGGELTDLLAAAAAGGAQLVAAACHCHLGDAPLASHDHGHDGRGLGADPLWVGGVLDVAAAVDRTALAPHRGADVESGIGGVGRRPRGIRGGDDGFRAHSLVAASSENWSPAW